MRTLIRLLGLTIFQSFTRPTTNSYGVKSSGNLLRLFSGKNRWPGGHSTQTARTEASPSLARRANWRLVVLGALILLPLLAGCTRNIGGEGTGWNPPASKDGVVYVATKEGLVIALVDNGFEGVRESWIFPPSQSQPGLQGVYHSPLVVGDLVYVSAQDGFLYAIDKETGSLASGGWRRPQGQPEELEPLIAGPAYDPVNDLVLAPSEDGRLYAYNAKSGDRAWDPFQTGAAIWSTPAVENGIGYFGSHDHKVYAVTLNDGKQLWQYETGGVVADGKNIFAPNMDGNIYALDRNGNLLWKHDVGSAIVSSPVLVPRGLVVAAKVGKLILLDTGPANLGLQRELSNLTLGDAEIKAPLFADGDSVYVGSQDSTVRRIEVRGGQVVMWCLHTEGEGCN